MNNELNKSIAVLTSRVAKLEAANAHLKMQAQSWAMEAKMQRSIVHECLQAASGATGEKADWNGSVPVRKRIEELMAVAPERDGRKAP